MQINMCPKRAICKKNNPPYFKLPISPIFTEKIRSSSFLFIYLLFYLFYLFIFFAYPGVLLSQLTSMRRVLLYMAAVMLRSVRHCLGLLYGGHVKILGLN
jgi:hypothetical protein